MNKIVEVIWNDACLEEATITEELALAMVPKIRKNVGYLVSVDSSVIILTHGMIENSYKGLKGHDLTFAIPMGCVVEINYLIKEEGWAH